MNHAAAPRMAGRNFLFVPGPTNVPDRVQRAMMVAMEDHRSPTFPELTARLRSGLRTLFKSSSAQIVMFPSSGTGAWEAALTNTLSTGDLILASRFGQFSQLWIEMARKLGFEVQVLDCEWGEGAPIDRIEQALRKDTQHRIKAVLACHNETATGVTSDIAAIRGAMDAARHPALLYVDGVSSIACIDFRMDEWGVDLAVCGSQKGLMLPPGLGILAVSPRAITAASSATSRRCYFDLIEMIKANATGYFPSTPPLSLLHGLRESLDMLFEEGLDTVFARHRHLARGVRAAVVAGWKLPLCAKAPEWYSDTVSAVVVPEGIDGARVINVAFRRYNLALGAGLSKVAGRVFRIGHLGDLNELMLMGALAGTEMAMLDVGIPVTPGSGVAAASNFWRGQRRTGQQNGDEALRLDEMPAMAFAHGRRQVPATSVQ
jgi:alanine-glyoxylate transaminase / serine-glyoxylate transaminase / serine-pyruvate transaminase